MLKFRCLFVGAFIFLTFLGPASAQIIHCSMFGDGELASGDSFSGSATVYLDVGDPATGTWDHVTSSIPLDIGYTCSNRDLVADRVCTKHEQAGRIGPLTSPFCADRPCRRVRFVGVISTGNCLINGSFIVRVSGSGTWNGEPGYSFEVNARSPRDPASTDLYGITIFAPDGSVRYEVPLEEVSSGDIDVSEP